MKRNRRWIWFFVVLFGLAAAGITWEVVYNLRQQLTPEQVAAARERWRANGPRDYTLEYSVKRDTGPDLAGTVPERYTVEVRGGKVQSVTWPNGRPLRREDYDFDSMDSLLDYVARRVQEDREPGRPRVFAVAQFDAEDGHVLHYVRSVMKTRERLEVETVLRPAP
ncbi:MAG TPA: DUF6174 domain-containing protein [Gemmataceae bacterium]|nr:DUF6174 domain-containing protein [Gemmataceae bacterium]